MRRLHCLHSIEQYHSLKAWHDREKFEWRLGAVREAWPFTHDTSYIATVAIAFAFILSVFICTLCLYDRVRRHTSHDLFLRW
jgi:hypothetical protein